jgi:hypothetical protein
MPVTTQLVNDDTAHCSPLTAHFPGWEKRMAEERDDEELLGHDSTTAPGGNKERSGDPGRTPGKAEGDEETVDEDLREKG